MNSLYDVQQLLKRFGVIVYVGKRIYDIELMNIELKDLFEARLIDQNTYLKARNILIREHRIEESREDH